MADPTNNSLRRGRDIVLQVTLPIAAAVALILGGGTFIRSSSSDSTGEQLRALVIEHTRRTDELVDLSRAQTRLLRAICRDRAISDFAKSECER